jgi:ribosome-binding protein aMBF1 (putative translation factor)
MSVDAEDIRPLPLPGYGHYSIDMKGNVWSAGRHPNGIRRKLKPFVAANGYLTVCLSCKRKLRPSTIHTLLLKTFIGDPLPGQVARHLNGNPLDNRLENLAWGSVQENIDDRTRHGRTPKGSRHYAAKLTESEVAVIRERYAAGALQADLALRYGVDQTLISMIVRGKIWRHVAVTRAKEELYFVVERKERD